MCPIGPVASEKISASAWRRPLRQVSFLTVSADSSSDCLVIRRALQRGFMISTNISKSASEPFVHVKSVIKGRGEPGYFLTAGT